ncbi:MAG: hypothetical protein J1E04_03975 [Alistipes sp.]|nr:hypothetical protein [Alistipes sp.]
MNNSNYTLKEVRTVSDEKEFLELPKRLYRNEPNWVCPLDDDIRNVFDPAKNKKFQNGEAVRWLAIAADGHTAGRIAAFYNTESAAIEEQPTGGCGFFEAENNQEVANLLFDAARDWLASKGMEAMDGPVNFGSRDSWWGVLVEGFEYTPLYANPYNFPYYKELFENYGFQNYFNQFSYVWNIGRDAMNERVYGRAERIMNTPGYTFSTIDMNDLEGAAENVRQIYNKAWALFPGVKPMSEADVQHMMHTLKPIIDPDLIYFAHFNGQPVGFFVMVPDLNRIIGPFNGRFGLWQKLQLMWKLKVNRSCDRIFGIIFGIAPEYHGKGIESGIFLYIYKNFFANPQRKRKFPYKSFEFAWIGDFNPVMNRMIVNYVGASKHKMHTTYRYLFDRTKEFKRCPRLDMIRPETAAQTTANQQ